MSTNTYSDNDFDEMARKLCAASANNDTANVTLNGLSPEDKKTVLRKAIRYAQHHLCNQEKVAWLQGFLTKE